jgi:hypothetical protein
MGCTGEPKDTESTTEPPSGGTLLGTTGVQADPNAAIFYQTSPGNVAEDSDVYVVHEDFYGIPWGSFLAGDEPPAPWVASIDVIADDARASGRPVYLALALVGGPGRAYLGNQTVVDENALLSPQSAWSAECYDFASAPDAADIEAAYLAYVSWMVERFGPSWLNVAIEINLFLASCPDAWPGLAAMETKAVEHARTLDPDLVVFASVELSQIYGLEEDCTDPEACFQDNLAALALLDGDRLALSSYPYGQPDIATVADIPADWLSRIADEVNRPVIIAETGWNGSPIVGSLEGDCVSYGSYSEADQIAYLEWLMGQSDDLDMELVTWWSNRDLIPAQISDSCECTAEDQGWCDAVDVFSDVFGEFNGDIIFKYWGTMGLRTYEGDEKPALMERWRALRSR